MCWQFGCRTIPKFAQVRPCEAQNAHEDHHYNFKWILVFFWFRFGFFLVFAFFKTVPPLFSFGKSGLSQPKKEDEFKKKVQKPKKNQKKTKMKPKSGVVQYVDNLDVAPFRDLPK